jgi:hypothetical protein
MTKFEGTFTNFKNEKLDEFYSAIGKFCRTQVQSRVFTNISQGIPWVARKMMTASSPTIEISKKDDKWTIKTSTLMSSSSNTFQLGEEYEETMMGGRSIKVKYFVFFSYSR